MTHPMIPWPISPLPDLAEARKVARWIRRWGVRRNGYRLAAWESVGAETLLRLMVCRMIHLHLPFGVAQEFANFGAIMDWNQSHPPLYPSIGHSVQAADWDDFNATFVSIYGLGAQYWAVPFRPPVPTSALPVHTSLAGIVDWSVDRFSWETPRRGPLGYWALLAHFAGIDWTQWPCARQLAGTHGFAARFVGLKMNEFLPAMRLNRQNRAAQFPAWNIWIQGELITDDGAFTIPTFGGPSSAQVTVV